MMIFFHSCGHLHCGQELPGCESVNKETFQDFMCEIANGTTAANEQFEQAKAVLKARGHKV